MINNQFHMIDIILDNELLPDLHTTDLNNSIHILK